jgi:peptidyl-dipeptidase Dcp
MHRTRLRRAVAALAMGALLFAAAFGACVIAKSPDTARVNPFLTASTLPFQAPPFDLIRDSDYQPAIEEGMKRQQAEIERIADNPAPPTFGNTIVAMEKSGSLLQRVTNVFTAITQANTDDTLQKVEAEEAPRLAAHQDAIYLNSRLFARVQAVYAQRASLAGTAEARQLVTVYYQQFVRAGARLPEADKAKLRAINEQLSTLQTAFEQKLLAAGKAGALITGREADLAGLAPAEIAAAAQAARARGIRDEWLIPLQNTTQQPDLAALKNRSVRRQLFDLSWNRAERGDANDTRETIETMAYLRAQKAGLLGFPDFAAYALDDQMAKTPQAVQHFLGELVPPTVRQADAEAKTLQDLIRRDGGRLTLEPWDWEYYSEQERRAKYNVADSEVKPYLLLDNVLQRGLFYAAHRLYGITFRERKDLPVYQPDVRVFEVFDTDGSPRGLVYFDFFKRDNKDGGAWMNTFVGQSKLLGTLPVVYNVENFAPPAPGQPALLTTDDVVTMFHEFGHGLHELFADQDYPTLSGVNVANDFVEFPSQFNEHWALYPPVLEHYAIHYRTGKPMPAALLARIKRAAGFNQGYVVGETLAAAELDMQWHMLPASAPKQDADSFETAALEKVHMDLKDVPPRYRSSYFLHIWANDYEAEYYSYLWTQMLCDDAFDWFVRHGGLTRANGQRFRDLILSRGHTEGYDEMFRAFYGKDPQIGPMLKYRGLTINTSGGASRARS